MTALDTELREAMLAWAKSSRGDTAAVQLLIDTGWIPEQLHRAGCTREVSPGVVAPLFGKALAADFEALPYLSHSEQALLKIAASLSRSVYTVSLADALGWLDRRNARHVMTAFATALDTEESYR